MKLNRTFSLSINLLFHSKLRTWLTILGIVIGIGCFVTIFALGNGMENFINERMSKLQIDLIQVTPGYSRAGAALRTPDGKQAPEIGIPFGGMSGTVVLEDKDVSALKSISGVKLVGKEITGNAEIYFAGESLTRRITGMSLEESLHLTTIELDSGRMLQQGDKYAVLIGDKIAEEYFSKEIPLNMIISINDKSFRVVGIMDNSMDVIMPLDTAYEILPDSKEGEYDVLLVKVENKDIVDDVVAQINSKLFLTRHVNEKTKNFTVTAMKDVAEVANQMTDAMLLFLTIMAVIALVVGGVGIANTMFTSVLERTKDIGIMKSIGAKNSDIFLIFILNSALFGLIGGAIGVTLGYFLHGVLWQMIIASSTLTFHGSAGFTIGVALQGILLAVGVSVISGLIPAYRASKLKPVQALRYE